MNGKKEMVEEMFDAIAPNYDRLNHILSLGIDKKWRRKVAKIIAQKNRTPNKLNVLDVATGTADLIIEMSKTCDKNSSFVGIDISAQMLKIGESKLRKIELNSQLIQGDALSLPFPKDSFEAVTCAYGVRNFEDAKKGVTEMYRVLKNEGVCVILEYSPRKKKNLWNRVFELYFKRILPWIGSWISKNKNAYRYLPKSVENFYTKEEFSTLIAGCGFQSVVAEDIMGGVVTLYQAIKKE